MKPGFFSTYREEPILSPNTKVAFSTIEEKKQVKRVKKVEK